MKAKLREKYAGLSRQQLLDKAYELGVSFEVCSQSCSQSTVAAIHEMLDIDDMVVKLATSSAGGQAGQVVGTCGGLVGGTMVLDYFFGRPVENLSHTECTQANLDLLPKALGMAGLLYEKYVKEYGTIICPHIQAQLYGRHFYFLDEEEMAKFDRAGGHADSPSSCCHIVGNAARWVMEILLDNNVIDI
jgi:C_GCAxxG_C_C family probable redox protein